MTHIDYHWKAFIFLCSVSLCPCLSLTLHNLLCLPPSRVFTLLSPPTYVVWSASYGTFSASISTRLTGKSYLISNTQTHTQIHLFKPSHKSHQSSDSLWIDCTSIIAKPCPGRRGGASGSRGWEPATMTTGLLGTLSLLCSRPSSQVMTTTEVNWATSRMKLPPRCQEATWSFCLFCQLASLGDSCPTLSGNIFFKENSQLFVLCLSSCEGEGNGAFWESWVRFLGWADSLEPVFWLGEFHGL